MDEIRVASRYRVRPRIGNGSFGDVHSGVDTETGEKVAIKLEKRYRKSSLLPGESIMYQVPYESVVYRVLQGGRGIPTFKWGGREGDFHVLVTQRLGPSLYDLFKFCNRKFTLKTVLLLADQMISRLEFMHSRSFIHRDLKPQNFLIGRGRHKMLQRVVYMIDFGLALKYQDPFTGEHISYAQGLSMAGTACFASINALSGKQQSRRDDMEALGFVLMYLLRGSLPWEEIRVHSRYEAYALILESKRKNHPDELCRNYPQEFKEYFAHCSSLEFKDKPDYKYLRSIFRGLFERAGYEDDGVFDWELHLNAKADGSPGLEGLQYLPEDPIISEQHDNTGEDAMDILEKSHHSNTEKSGLQEEPRRSRRIAACKRKRAT